MPVLSVRDTRTAALSRLRRLPAVLAGAEPDPTGMVDGLLMRAGVAALSEVQQAFIIKSRGGTGADGIRWRPLSARTIAARRTTAAERKQLGITGRRYRGLLTGAEDRLWKQIFATRLAQLRMTLPEAEAKARAGQIAWAVLKKAGAKTKLAVLGGRQVDIGRDSGRLFRSLSAGTADRPSGADGQVFRLLPGAVRVGTNVVYAGPFHEQRPLWVEGGLAPAQRPAVLRAIRRGILTLVERTATGGR